MAAIEDMGDMEDTGSAGGVKDWSLVGSGGGVGREGEGVEDGSELSLPTSGCEAADC